MSDEYTVVTRDGRETCGHAHRTAEAANRCRLALCGQGRYHQAEVRRNGERANGIGLWANGEPRP